MDNKEINIIFNSLLIGKHDLEETFTFSKEFIETTLKEMDEQHRNRYIVNLVKRKGFAPIKSTSRFDNTMHTWKLTVFYQKLDNLMI